MESAEREDEFRIKVLMERIAAALHQHGPLAARKLEQIVTGKAATLRQALAFLQIDGYVRRHLAELKPAAPEV